MFGIIPQHQTVIVDPVDLTRHLQLNFTRYAGLFGSVILTFTVKYDIVSVLLYKLGYVRIMFVSNRQQHSNNFTTAFLSLKNLKLNFFFKHSNKIFKPLSDNTVMLYMYSCDIHKADVITLTALEGYRKTENYKIILRKKSCHL